MRIRILGRTWNVGFVVDRVLDGDKWADVDQPNVAGKSIRLHDGLRGKMLADAVIHESLHAGTLIGKYEILGEQFVEQMATDIARALYHPEILARLLDDDAVRAAMQPKVIPDPT